MAGKKKAKKKVGRPAKKKVTKKKAKGLTLDAWSKKDIADAKKAEKLECRHVYCVMPRYATNTLCEFTTLEAAQEMIEANKQINNVELCVVVMPGAEYRSTEW